MRIGRHGLDAAFCGIKVGAFADSVGAVVRRSIRIVIRVVRAPKAVIVQAASGEMASSSAEVIAADTGDVSSTDAADVRCAKPSDAASAEAASMAAAKATDVSAAEATHVAATKTTAVSAATAAAGLCAGGNKAAGKQRTCQNHHPSSSHDISPFERADVPPQDLHRMPLRLGETGTDDTMLRRWELSPAVSIKISLNNRRIAIKSERAATGRQTEASAHADGFSVFAMLNSFLVAKAASLGDL